MAKEIEDGGAAFPTDAAVYGNGTVPVQPGMSLRDWLAGQALAGMLASGEHPASEETMLWSAYRYADAAIQVRKHPTPLAGVKAQYRVEYP